MSAADLRTHLGNSVVHYVCFVTLKKFS